MILAPLKKSKTFFVELTFSLFLMRLHLFDSRHQFVIRQKKPAVQYLSQNGRKRKMQVYLYD